MTLEERWSERTRARILTQIRILAHLMAIAEGWEPRELAARTFSERILQDIVDALVEAEDGQGGEEDTETSDIGRFEEAVSMARAIKEGQPEGWDVGIVGRIRDDGSLSITLRSVTRAPSYRGPADRS